MMKVSEGETNPNSTELVSEVLRERTTAQLAQLDGLDSKAATALGFAGVLLGLLFANSSITESWNGWLTAAAVFLVLSTIALAASLWVRDWMLKPTESKLRSWSAQARGETQQLLAASLEAALVHNREKVTKKVRSIRIGMGFLTCAIAVAAVGLLIARGTARMRRLRLIPHQPTQLLEDKSMSDDEAQQPPPEPKPDQQTEVEPVGLQEPEVQQEIADDSEWMQKGLNSDDSEER